MSRRIADRVRSPWKGAHPWADGWRGARWRRILKRLVDVRFVAGGLRHYFGRGRTWLLRRRTNQGIAERIPVFVVGSNRSGTQMVCEAIGRSPHGWDYPEYDFRAFRNFHLRSPRLIKRLIRRSPAPIVCFGSILDSQFTDDILSEFTGARALWVYRRYQDAGNSSVLRWGSHQKDWARRVAHGELESLGPRGKRISIDTVQLIAELYREDLSDEDGACLYWYLRNQLFFDLGLDRDSRVLIVEYEDAVINPEKAFRRVFDFLGFPYDPAIIEEIFPTSVGQHPWPAIDPRIEEVCDTLKARLDTQYAETSNRTGTG